MSSAIAALESGANVLMLEKASKALSGGNTVYTAGAMRFAYEDSEQLLPLISNTNDERLLRTDFGSYTEAKFAADLSSFNEGLDLSPEQLKLVSQSYDAVKWLASHGIKLNQFFPDRVSKKITKLFFGAV